MSSILQFGTGRFLRGFFDCIVETGSSITIVQSRKQSTGAQQINEQNGRYHVWTRGKLAGQIVNEYQLVDSIDRAVVAWQQWSELLDLARDANLTLLVSNTTEQGLALDPDERRYDPTSCPHSFPGKVLSLLKARFDSGLAGLTILPMELVEFNANRLCELVLEQATIWELNDERFLTWLTRSNRWLNNLVDRIVVGVNDDPPWAESDPLAVVAEPYRLLAIEDDGGPRDVIPQHSMIQWTKDLEPLFLRKVRILNGLHTAMVAHSMPRGFKTVLDAVSDPDERRWLDTLLANEILPALESRGLREGEFAAAVMERFENPFFRHLLSDIAKGHDEKLKTRLLPTIDDYRKAFGRPPRELSELVDARTD